VRVCVCLALGIQNAVRMRRVILSSVAWHALQYFSTLTHKLHKFNNNNDNNNNNVIEYEMCFDFLYNFYQKKFSFLEELSEIWSGITLALMSSTHNSCQILIEFGLP